MATMARKSWIAGIAVLAAFFFALLLIAAQPANATHDSSKVKLQLRPATDINTVGQQHCVTATVEDSGHGDDDEEAAGVQVVFSVSGANPTPTNVVVVTDEDGEARFCYIGTRAGTDTITAFADLNRNGQLNQGEPSASVTKIYRPGAATRITLAPAAATNPVGQQHCVTATVEDQFGNRISGARVVFRVTGANTASGTVNTNASGQAQFCYTGQNAGVDTIRAFVDTDRDGRDVEPGEPVTTATKTYLAPGPTTLTLAPPADTNRAGEQHCVTATAKDALGNPVSGVPIVFRVTGANTAGATVTTNASGQAQFCYTGKNVGLDVITAYADADKDNQQDATELVATATKTYLPGAPATVTLEPPASENTVGTQHCVTATVKDEFGNPTPNETVVFTVTGANPATASVKTDQNGNAVFCYTGQRSGLDTIRAFVDTDNDATQDAGEPVAAPVTKLYHPGVPRTVTLEPKLARNVVGEEHCVTATAHDEFGNRVGAGHPIVFEVAGANEVGPTTVMTNANGQARFCYTGTNAGEDVITAFADNDRDGQRDPTEVPGTATKTYLPGPPANVNLAPETDTNRAGERHCVTATVTDRFGNPVSAGHPIRFSISGANPTAEDVVVATNAEGKAQFCYAGTRAGTDTITAFADNNANATLDEGEPRDTATKIYRPGPPANVVVTPAADENTVGEEHCVTATVKDEFGNVVEPGTAVFFSVTGANPTANPVKKTTDANGQAVFCYTGTKAGVDAIRAVADANENGQLDTTDQLVFGVAEKTYLPGPPANLELEPPTATNRAGEEHCVTATVTDRFGNPVSAGHPIVFSVTDANPTAEDVVVVTNAEGKAQFCYAGTKAGTDTITAFADNNKNGIQNEGEPSDTATKTYRPGPPATVVLEPPTAENIAGEEHCVTATVEDRFRNRVEAGTDVFFSVTGANPREPVRVETDANGQAKFCYTGTKAGVDTIRAVADSNENGQLDAGDTAIGTATKVYKPGPPANLVLSPKTATNVVGEEHCVTATVTDQFGNPTPGIKVVFSVTGAVVVEGDEAQLGTGGTVTTNGQGQAEFCYTSQLPGVNTITAFADTNENGVHDPPGEPSDVATKTYVLPPSTAFCEVTVRDGGWIVTALGDKGTFGGNAKTDSGGKVVSGSQEYTDHGPATPVHVKSTEILAVTCNAGEAEIYGFARVDEAEAPYATGTFFFRVTVRDSGEPGRADTYDILVGNGYYTGPDRPLQGGNIQIRLG